MVKTLIAGASSTVAQPDANDANKVVQLADPCHPRKVITVAGPNGSTAWTATVVVGTTPDRKGWSPSTKSYQISNTTPYIDEILDTPCHLWGAWITAYTGDATNQTGVSNGRTGIDVMVEA